MDSKHELPFASVLASTVHEMKNALGMVLGSLDEITETPEGYRCTPEQLAKLRYEAKRVNDHLVQLLTLYRVENQLYYVHLSENGIAEFFAEILLQNQAIAKAKGIEIDLVVPRGLEWYFDRELISGVLNSAFENALRYTTNRLRLRAEEQEGHLAIHLEDDGTGFPPTMLSSQSPRQQRISFSSGRTGLGLYFCSLVASMHKQQGRRGRIELANDGVLGGARFSIFLP